MDHEAFNSANWTGHGELKSVLEPPKRDDVGHLAPFLVAVMLSLLTFMLCNGVLL